jgi:iron complex outermembrane receptor protein
MVTQHDVSKKLSLSKIWAVALCLYTLSPAVREARAQDETLLFQDVTRVSGASRYEQDTREAPASVTIITAEDIRRFGYRTLAEALQNVRGMVVSDDHNYSYIGVRGFAVPGDYNSRVLFLVDGHSINEGVFESALIGQGGLIDMRAVERIEVIRGPGSSVYGTSALFAVVNIVTRRGRALQGFEVTSSAGSWDSYRAAMTMGRRFAQGPEILVSTSAIRSAGQDWHFADFDTPATNGGWAVRADAERADRQFARVDWGDWTVEFARNWRQKHIPTGSYATIFDDARALTRDSRSMAVVRFDHGFGDASRFISTLGYDVYSYRGHYPYVDGLFTDYANARWWSYDGQYVRSLGKSHHVVAGTAIVWNSRQDQGGDNVDSGTVVFRSRRDGVVWALFAQDEWRVWPRLLVSAGVRHDHYETFGGTTNPRLSIVYRAGNVAAVKLLYGAAFRAPNAYELDYQDGGISTKRPVGLRPEVVKSYELVFEGVPTPGLHLTASLFALRLRDLVRQVVDPTDSLLVFRNMGQARSIGIELEADVRLTNGVNAGLSYAHQDGDDPATGTDLPSSPYHLVDAHFSAPLFGERARASVVARHVSSQTSIGGTVIPASTVADLTVFGRVTLHVNLLGAVYNIFDATYAQPGGSEQVLSAIPQSRRTARLGLQMSF